MMKNVVFKKRSDVIKSIIDKFDVKLIAKFGSRKKTAKNYSDAFSRFLMWCDFRKKIELNYVNDARKINRDIVEDYLAYLNTRFNNLFVANMAIAAIKQYFTLCFSKPSILSIKVKKPTYRKQVFLENNELLKLFESCKNDKERLIISLLGSSGLRVSELVNLKCINVDIGKRKLKVIFGKGGKDRDAEIGRCAVHLIEDIIEKGHEYVVGKNKDGTKLSTRSIENYVKNISKRAGIKKVSPHTLRRTYANMQKEDGVELKDISRYLGHGSINTTKFYIKNFEDEFKTREYNPMDKVLGLI